MVYAHFQVVLLHSREHESNYINRERIGSQFNEIDTPLVRPVHLCITEVSKI